MSNFFTDKTVLVTGAYGFLGKVVTRKIDNFNYKALITPTHKDYDLRHRYVLVQLLCETRPDIVIHLAASVGGIGANTDSPGTYFFDNAIMGIQLIDCAKEMGIEKFVCVGTVCSYPKFTEVPFKEDDIWNGYPEETNAPYGLAKKMLLVQLQAYRKQYNFNGIYVIPTNLFGPGDNFDWDSSHVIPAMIRKFIEAKEAGSKQVVLWGDGSPTRDFLYVEDAADGIIKATENYNDPEPVNLGSGVEISMRKLAIIISRLTGYQYEIVWDTTKPNGQPRRMVDASRAEKAFGFKAMMGFEEGLKRAIRWYKDESMKGKNFDGIY